MFSREFEKDFWSTILFRSAAVNSCSSNGCVPDDKLLKTIIAAPKIILNGFNQLHVAKTNLKNFRDVLG